MMEQYTRKMVEYPYFKIVIQVFRSSEYDRNCAVGEIDHFYGENWVQKNSMRWANMKGIFSNLAEKE